MNCSKGYFLGRTIRDLSSIFDRSEQVPTLTIGKEASKETDGWLILQNQVA